MIEERLLRREERAVFALRGLYRKYGYLPFKMSKFEEYELYLRNKDFLVSDRIISFNDTNGSLMALKPDVTLSIIKNSEDIQGVKQKVCYNENVYRVSESTQRFKEIMQAGLECIGDIDLYDIYEVISLAAQSLALISSGFVLEISDLDVLEAALTEICADIAFKEEAIGYIAQKNAHDLRKLCRRFGISDENARRLQCFTDTYDSRRDAIRALRDNFAIDVSELTALSDMLDASPYSEHICFDFSSVNDMNYYNGFVFKGYLDGVCDGVLSGGQYDKMMSRMQRKSGAIGFALYLDMLEQLRQDEQKSDVDILLLYDDTASGTEVAAKIQSLISVGLSVSAQKAIPEKLRCGKIIDMRKEKDIC